MLRQKFVFVAVATSIMVGNSANAAFHLMQIEQVIGGLNGDSTAQAIQLRMRSSGQNVVSSASLWASDAAGANRVLLLNIGTNVTNSALGAHILLTTSSFNTTEHNINPSFSSDFTLANPIPASYLTAGRLTFEADGGSISSPGTIYWSLSWGGSGYTGSTTGNTANDTNGAFGPSFGSALPGASLQSLQFTGAASAFSTTNLADYALSANPATVTINSGTSFTVVGPAAIPGDYNGDHHVDASDYSVWRQSFGSTVTASSGADGNGSGKVDAADYVIWREHQGQSGTGLSVGGSEEQGVAPDATIVPEPATIALLISAFTGLRWRRH